MSVDKCKSTVLDFGVDVKCTHVLSKICSLDSIEIKLLFLPVLFILLIVRRIILITDVRKSELFILEAFDLSQLVEMHLTQVEDHVVLLDLPIER